MKKARMIVSQILLVVHNLNFLFWGCVWILRPASIFGDAFSKYAGGSWIDLGLSDRELVQMVEHYGRFLGIHGIIIAILLTLLCFTAFRRREKWSWIAVLIASAIGWGAAMGMDVIMKSPEMLWVDIAPLALAMISVALAIPDGAARGSRPEHASP
jgi:hypothetical protein